MTFGLLQTCGTPPGADCSESECGGPNCRTDEGEKKCGGPGCGGLVTVAHSAWQKAMDFDRDVLSALAEVEQLSKMVSQQTGSGFVYWLAVSGREDLKRSQFHMLTKFTVQCKSGCLCVVKNVMARFLFRLRICFYSD